MNQINADRGSEMIMELSEVMRYHLEFSKAVKVKLLDEIQLLESYVKLERLRLRETCKVRIDFENVDNSKMISPLLLLPFVENAFKHGTHPTKDCFVDLELKTKHDKLNFKVKNSMVPDQHELTITRDNKAHLVEMQIDL